MGKFDQLEKYLGKEDQFDPMDINNALDGISEDSADMGSLSDDEIDPDALANIDELLKVTGDNEPDFSLDNQEDTDISLSGSELDAIQEGDTDSFLSDDSQDMDLSQFSALNMDDDDAAAQDLAALQQPDFESDFAADSGPQEQETTDLAGGMDFSAMDSSPADADEPVPAASIDPEVLDQLQNLDSAPPPISEIQTRRYTEDLGASEEVSNIESDLAALASRDVEFTEHTPEGAPLELEEIDADITDGTEEGEFGDLLSQLSPHMGTEEPGDEPDSGPLMPEIGSEMDELSSMLAGETEETETNSFGNDFSFEPPAQEESAGGFDFPDAGFEMPDFGSEETESLKAEPGSETTDFGFSLDSEDTSPAMDFGGLEETGSESAESFDFELPGDTGFGMETPEAETGFADFSGSTDSDFGSDMDAFSMQDVFAPLKEDTPGSVNLESFDDVDNASAFTPLDDRTRVSGGRSTATGSQINMDAEKALRIRNRINQISDPKIRKMLRNAFLDPGLPADKVEQLIAMLLLNEPEGRILEFVEKQLPSLLESMSEEVEDIEVRPEIPKVRPRRVIYAEDAKKAQEFQKEFQNYARLALAVVGSVVLLAFIIFRFVWAPSRASFHYNKGITSIRVGAYDNAEARFKEGENIGGFDSKWYNRFALEYIEKKEYKFATNKFYQVLENRPLDRETIFNFGRFLRSVYPPDYETAIRLYDRLYKVSRDDFEVIDEIGSTFMEWGDYLSSPDDKLVQYDKASQLYMDYLAKNQKHVSSYFKLLALALRARHQEQINNWYEMIQELNPKAVHLEILTELARYYIDQREMESARPILEKLDDYVQQEMARKEKGSLGDKKEFAVSSMYYQYARYFTINMDFVNALTVSSNAILWNPENGLVYNLMGEIYYVNNNLTNFASIGITNRSANRIAEDFFLKAAEYSPGYYKPWANLGHLHYYQKNYNLEDDMAYLIRATNYYYKAKELLPADTRDFNLQYNLGWMNYKVGNYSGAEEEWSDLYQEDPFNPVLSYAMGNTYFRQAMALLAQNQTREAVKRMNIAKVQFDKAIEYYDSIARRVSYINPLLERHQEIYLQLARAYNNRGVIMALYTRIFPRQKSEYEQKALLDFFKAKDSALKVDVNPYPQAEYNIKFIYHTLIKGREPAFDDTIPKRTTLQKLVDEFRNKLLQTL